MADSFEEKTEEASGHKIDEARNKGQVAKSMEMNSAFMLMFGLLLLYTGGGAIADKMSSLMQEILVSAGDVRLTVETVHYFFVRGVFALFVIVGPLMMAMMAVGAAANLTQVGFMFTTEALQPKWSKLNPLTGIKKVLLSRRSLMELVKGALKTLIVGLFAYNAFSDFLPEALNVMENDVQSIMGFMATAALGIGLKVGLAFFVLAAIDFGFQRFEFHREMRMTKQEVKEENKMLEGDPIVKGRIKTVQRQIAYKRMMQEVPKADVVVTNPTHFAVALKYDPVKGGAPRVVAKGADLIALRIKKIAIEHKVPVVEDKPLARALYQAVEIGQEIPEKLFQAVAQLLAYIYKLKRKTFVGRN